MNAVLTIQERLKDLRVERELTLEQLEQRTGISKSALGSYETEDYKDISHTSIVTLAKFYGVSADYLLGLTETKNHPNAALAELHLSDGMIVLLKSGNINTRLLCETAVHKDFVKLLADIEIYVDGIASMQIQNLNTLVDMAKIEIMDKHQPSGEEPYIRLLKAAHIEEKTYFQQVIHSDIDNMIEDIKEAHRQDSTSAPKDAVAEKTTGRWRKPSFTGSPQEKQVVVMCRQLRIDYTKLTPEEFQVMIRVLGKSKHLNIPKGKHRKKRK